MYGVPPPGGSPVLTFLSMPFFYKQIPRYIPESEESEQVPSTFYKLLSRIVDETTKTSNSRILKAAIIIFP